MARTKAAQKAARAAERRRLRNASARSATKTSIIRAERLIGGDDPEAAQQAVVAAISALDRAARKGTMHPNTAARRKSHLVKRLNQATSSTAGQPETTDAETG